ncbi:MAG: C1 family peptidase [Phycisphaerae bacterium]|nr:C1 family peptidase [Phycisphaerae bacterium]
MSNLITLSNGRKVGTGRLIDVRTPSDYYEDTIIAKPDKKVSVPNVLAKFNPFSGKTRPKKTNNRIYSPPIDNQLTVGRCTAERIYHDVAYFIKRKYDKEFYPAANFNYKCSRWLLDLKGDTGSTGSAAMQALRHFGAIEKSRYPDDPADFDQEPTTFDFAYADNFEATSWVRIDPPNLKRKDLLEKIKDYLVAGIPVGVAIDIRTSFELGNSPGFIPCPVIWESTLGLHEIPLVDYNDDIVITNTKTNVKTTGAFWFQNSWGKQWGINGCGWLPYEYILHPEYSTDFTVLLNMLWAD